jgi:hypothetical protein
MPVHASASEREALVHRVLLLGVVPEHWHGRALRQGVPPITVSGQLRLHDEAGYVPAVSQVDPGASVFAYSLASRASPTEPDGIATVALFVGVKPRSRREAAVPVATRRCDPVTMKP